MNHLSFPSQTLHHYQIREMRKYFLYYLHLHFLLPDLYHHHHHHHPLLDRYNHDLYYNHSLHQNNCHHYRVSAGIQKFDENGVFILSSSLFSWKEPAKKSGKESGKESGGIPSSLSGLFGWKESGLSLFRFFD